MGGSLVKAVGAGTVMQVLMVVVGHFLPDTQAWLFPIGGTLIGFITGWLAGHGSLGSAGGRATNGGIAGGVAGALGSLVSTALGDVPLGNIAIAGGSTLVAGAIGGVLSRVLGARAV
jgi:hypothetical protein